MSLYADDHRLRRPRHRQFHGTMWVDGPAFRQYVRSLTENLTYHGIDRVIYVNTTVGTSNTSAGSAVISGTTRSPTPSSGCETSLLRIWSTISSNAGPHGGPKETALVQYLHSDPVHE